MNQIDKYIQEKSLDIHKSIGKRTIIYLDTKFWIFLLERKDELQKQFYEKINQLFEIGKCIFPVSEILVAEIAKQQLGSRYRNIQLIDKFSDGFAIVNDAERRKIEFKHWLQKKIGIEKHELKELIWSTVPFSRLGYLLPKVSDNSTLQEHLNHLALDYIGDASLLEIEMGYSPVFTFQPDANILNNAIKEHAHEHTSLRELVLAEVLGILKEYKALFADITIDEPQIEQNLVSYLKQKGKSKEDHYMEAVFSHFYVNHMSNELPAFHIFPTLFAYIRFRDIKYQGGNDTIDFLHASSALPYCDYFFTDKKLYHRIDELKFDKLYNCTVEFDLERAIELLNSIPS